MTVSDALRHGFLDRGRKHFCNAHTGQLYSLDEALHNGWIITKSNYDRNRTQAGFSFKGDYYDYICTRLLLAIKCIPHVFKKYGF